MSPPPVGCCGHDLGSRPWRERKHDGTSASSPCSCSRFGWFWGGADRYGQPSRRCVRFARHADTDEYRVRARRALRPSHLRPCWSWRSCGAGHSFSRSRLRRWGLLPLLALAAIYRDAGDLYCVSALGLPRTPAIRPRGGVDGLIGPEACYVVGKAIAAAPFLFGSFTLLLALGLGPLLSARAGRRPELGRRRADQHSLILLLLTGSVVLSILNGGAHEHYLIQLFHSPPSSSARRCRAGTRWRCGSLPTRLRHWSWWPP